MSRGDRYDASDLPEAQYQPGSRGRVLRNLLGVTRKREMDRIEWAAQLAALERLLGEVHAEHRFTAADVRHIHATWLGGIYEWAGAHHRVNLTKGDFPFAAAAQIDRLMAVFDRDVLSRHTPCAGMHEPRLLEALAVVHAELILIHPFRDGNGRAARLLAVLMAAQAGLPPLDFSAIVGRARHAYFAAVRTALDRDYAPMERVFSAVIRRTRRTREGIARSASAEPSAPTAGA